MQRLNKGAKSQCSVNDYTNKKARMSSGRATTACSAPAKLSARLTPDEWSRVIFIMCVT